MSEIYAPRDWSSQPPYLLPGYGSTVLRAPSKALIPIRQSLSEITGPVYGHESLHPLDADLTRNAVKGGEPIGERIVVTGRVLDEDGRPLPDTLVEVWQANSAGRFVLVTYQHAAPLDPNFLGVGRCVTDSEGRYRFTTIKPGAYPWGNHENAWRRANIHFSLFGPSLSTRLVTQMYFPGDPLLVLDPVFMGTPADCRELLISRFMLEHTEPSFALGYEFDFVLRGRRQTPTE
jgi:protocatechuate 3,4-dioxygenase beta subunit